MWEMSEKEKKMLYNDFVSKQEEYLRVQVFYEVMLKCKEQLEVEFNIVQNQIVSMELFLKRFIVVDKVRELDYE